jgi:hypothetical protein
MSMQCVSIPELLCGVMLLIGCSVASAGEPMTVPFHCEMTSRPDPDIYTQKDELRFELVLEDVSGARPYCWSWQWGDRENPIVGDAMVCMKYAPAQNISRYVDVLDGVLEIQPDGTAVYDFREPNYPTGRLAEPDWVVTRYTGKCAKGEL